MPAETLTTGDGVRSQRAMLWGGYALSGLSVAFFLMDATMKLMQLPVVASTSEALGWGADMALPLGVTLLACTILYAVPQTAVLGAILLTGYLGGAVATHVRVGSPCSATCSSASISA